MREIRPSGSEGGVALTTPSLPLSILKSALVQTARWRFELVSPAIAPV